MDRAPSGPTWAYAGLSVFPPQNKVFIVGNRFADSQATPTQTWGIYINAGVSNGLIIANNDFTGNVTGPISLTGVTGTDHFISNNSGASVAIISNMPTSATGLVTGQLWRNGTVLNIV